MLADDQFPNQCHEEDEKWKSHDQCFSIKCMGERVGTFNDAVKLLLDGIQDVHARCFIAVLLGNDTFPTMLEHHTCFANNGPAAVQKMIQKIHDSCIELTFESLLAEAFRSFPDKSKDVAKFSQLSSDVVKALVNAMAFEPAAVGDSGCMLYSVLPPIGHVDQYIEDFVMDQNLVDHVCVLSTCLGPMPLHAHMFMNEEGSHSCGKCNKTYCLMCISVEGICIPCLGEASNLANDQISKMSEVQLHEALSQKIEVPATIPIANLQELYISIIEGNSMDSLDSDLLEQVKYPINQLGAINASSNGPLKFLS
jgi:hypothetical protein